MMSTSSEDNSGEAALVMYTYMNRIMAGKLLLRHLMAMMFINNNKLRK
jgi:hypothetical protein